MQGGVTDDLPEATTTKTLQVLVSEYHQDLVLELSPPRAHAKQTYYGNAIVVLTAGHLHNGVVLQHERRAEHPTPSTLPCPHAPA